MTLQWSRPSIWKRQYELREHGAVVARIEWPSWVGCQAVAQTRSGELALERTGFLRQVITVRRAGSELPLATMRPRFGGSGTIEIAGGRRYHWGKPSFWRTLRVLLDDSGRPLVHVQPSWLGGCADVTIAPGAESLDDLPLLLVFGWYLTVLYNEDAAGAAAATSAAT